MKITKENFRTARFTDNERTTIEVMLSMPENPAGEVTAFYLQVDETHPDFQDLMKVTSIPNIHTYTDGWIKDTREQFKKEVFDIAKREGIIKTGDVEVKEIEVKESLDSLIKRIFVEEIDYENEDIKEQMFRAKLAAFELPHVKSSTDKDLKTKLRKAETIKEVFKVLSHF